MKTKKHSILNANKAVAQIAYKTNGICPIYPITPASEMSEMVEEWSAQKQTNIFGTVPSVFEMQSEVGVAGMMHGALQTGSLATTFTASQGLLLMLPNMYKIAGELTPNVIHVATRSIATHALSIFGDHSDIMAVRQSGYAFLGSASVQEAQDFALISQAATLQSKIPFVHFFDGFRTSHETSKIELISDDIISCMVDFNAIKVHQNRALDPNNPIIRGTSQGSDVFFQSREAINPFYDMCPSIVQQNMDQFFDLTGRQYNLFDYVGHPKAEHIIISMASSTETIETTIKHLNTQGEKLGLIKVRLFRPFSTQHLVKAIPNTCKNISVLDRTKEPGSTGEPLYLDVIQSLTEAYQNETISTLPKIVGGRYGLSSKEFTPNMVYAIVKNLKQDRPKHNFTIGINDDVKNLSLDFSERLDIPDTNYQALFYQTKSASTCNDFSKLLELIGTHKYVQGYSQCDYKKSNSEYISHLRINNSQIKAPYLIEYADFIACQNTNFITKDDLINNLKPKGILLVNSSLTSKAFWQAIPAQLQYQIIEKEIKLYIVNLEELQEEYSSKTGNLSAFHACFLSLKNDLYYTDVIADAKDYIYEVDTSIGFNKEQVSIINDSEFSKSVLGRLLNNKGNSIPVSQLPTDGTYPTNTSQFNINQAPVFIPEWDENLCTQCGACSMACPQAALRIKVYDDHYLNNSPTTFKAVKSLESDWEIDLLNYTIQINPDQCNGCNNCVDACPSKALEINKKDNNLSIEHENWNHFDTIPEIDRSKIDTSKVSQQQLQEPLFKYSIGVEGCGEAPYLKLMSQLFGNRLLVANATGSSSIFGGALPTTPWSKNQEGKGPAWSNSLFEDNAEFGLGFRLSINQQEKQAKQLLEQLTPKLDFDLVYDILKADQSTELKIIEQRQRIDKLKHDLKKIKSFNAQQLISLADNLVKKSVWIVGGDGWAYDIGFGGIDHVIASGENINILVLDNEIYDNTGGQTSKATPLGASAKFSSKGKAKQKKDLGLMAMTYGNVYVASVSIGANQEQTLKAFNEAESFDGPSIIIAYTHSDSHGINMKKPSQYHKAAVNSGQWLLYRNDPRRDSKGENSLILDSGIPNLSIENYYRMENRFKNIFQLQDSELKQFFKTLQKNIDKRYNRYLAKSIELIPNRTKLLQNKRIKTQLHFRK